MLSVFVFILLGFVLIKVIFLRICLLAKDSVLVFLNFLLYLKPIIIMTSKEFLRRCEFFAVFDKAAQLFSEFSKFPGIYKFSFYGSSKPFETYLLTPSHLSEFGDSYMCTMNLICIEFFSRSQFDSQFKSFLSFLSRLSERQMNSLVSSGRFEHLLKIKDEMSK